VIDSVGGVGLPIYIVGELSDRAVAGSLTPDDQFVAELKRNHSRLRVVNGTELVQELRGKKSPTELAQIRRAVDITVEAQKEAIQAVRPAKNEYEIEALIEYVFRRNGAERPSFATIVGSGPNSTTLHYNADDRVIQPGDVVVMDIGASYNGYAADVTRTVPRTARSRPSSGRCTRSCAMRRRRPSVRRSRGREPARCPTPRTL